MEGIPCPASTVAWRYCRCLTCRMFPVRTGLYASLPPCPASRDQSFASLMTIITWCVQVLRSPKEAFAAAMQSWRERCEKCVCLQGDYVEKLLHFQLPVVSSFLKINNKLGDLRTWTPLVAWWWLNYPKHAVCLLCCVELILRKYIFAHLNYSFLLFLLTKLYRKPIPFQQIQNIQRHQYWI